MRKIIECKYENREKDHVYCTRDGSVRKHGCPCPNYKPTLWMRIKKKLGL